MRRRELAFRLILLVLGSALGLAAAELGVRLFEPPPSHYTGRGLYQPDPDLGHVLRPNQDNGDIHVNSFGFRDREYPLTKAPGTFRIVGIGDSFTFGNSFPRGIYLKVLEAKLAHAARPVEVINTGVPAYSTVQEIGHLKKFGLRFSPDLVILGLFPTGDAVENRSDEHLQVVDGELTDTAVGRWERWLLRWHLYRFLMARGVVHAAAPAALPPLTERDAFLGIEFERLQVCRRSPRRYISQSYEITERLLADLKSDLDGRHVGLVVLLIPDEVQVSTELFAEVLKARGGQAADYDVDRPTRRFREFCSQHGIAVVDVLEDCRARNVVEPVYRPGDTHWNEAGVEIAAEKLYRHLLASVPGLRSAPGG